MTEFTKEDPFEFEGVKVYPMNTPGISRDVAVEDAYNYAMLPRDHAEAIHAFIAAEQSSAWRWTNDAHTEARKGRWVASKNMDPLFGFWGLTHDEVEGISVSSGSNPGSGQRTHQSFVVQLRDFEKWRDAQPPTFTPLPIPEVGAYISATLRDGRVVEGEVRCARKIAYLVWIRFVESHADHFINLTEDVELSEALAADIIAWHPIARPEPEEPTGLGAVVEIAGRTYFRSHNTGYEWCRDSLAGTWMPWSHLVKLGPVTVLSEGVTK